MNGVLTYGYDWGEGKLQGRGANSRAVVKFQRPLPIEYEISRFRNQLQL